MRKIIASILLASGCASIPCSFDVAADSSTPELKASLSCVIELLDGGLESSSPALARAVRARKALERLDTPETRAAAHEAYRAALEELSK